MELEKRYRVGRQLARQLGVRPETLRRGFVLAGCKLEKPGARGLLISEGELQRYLDWTRKRAAAGGAP